MKPVLDKEIDSLLRRSPATALWPKGESTPASAREREHLDADELNAYAENALPAVSRARFASHLADCDKCRKIVVELAMSADAAGELEKRAAVPLEAAQVPTAWRAWLGALFAPRLLRYAVPLVAFCIVGAITFIALRTRRNEQQSALPTPPGESRSVESAHEVASGTTSSNAPLDETSGQATNTTNTAQATKPAPVSSTANANSNSSISVDGVDKSAKDALQPTSPLAVNGRLAEKEIAADKPQPKTESAPPPAAAGAGVPAGESDNVMRAEMKKAAPQDAERQQNTHDEAASNSEVARRVDNLSQSRPSQNAQQSPDGSRNAQRSASNNAGLGMTSSSAAAAPASREARASRRSRATTDEVRDDKEEASLAKAKGETRGVSGHHFQQRDGVWVDVNYKPSMAMTGVRRDTEGYRALIADVPELGRIADQLGGEVIVVVKGRAYRIR